MEAFTIRTVQIEDAEQIYVLNQEFNPKFYQFTAEQVQQRIRSLLINERDIVLIAEKNQQVIGFIHGSLYELLFSELMVHVVCLIVSESNRQQGVGSQLLAELEQWATQQGAKAMKLLSHPIRTNAHRLYEKRGYTYTKDQKNFVKQLL